MEDKTKQIRDIELLKEPFLTKVKKWLKEVTPLGVFIVETWRSEERQKEIVKSWASKVSHSNHQDWMAVDIWFTDDQTTKEKEAELYPKKFERWRKVADIAKKYWIEWWYDLWAKDWFIDLPHFQNSNLPIIKLKMTELETKQLNALVALISATWIVTWSVDLKNKLAEMNKYLREEITKYS